MNGFHDGCNAVSTVIYTGALKPKFAIALSAFFNFAGPLIMGVAVAKTIGGVIKAEDATAHLVIAALLAALLWDVLTWIWALPVSSSHALVGGLIGAGMAASGHGRHQLGQGGPGLRLARSSRPSWASPPDSSSCTLSRAHLSTNTAGP